MQESTSAKKFTLANMLGTVGGIFGLVCSIVTLLGGVRHGDAVLHDAVEGTWTLTIQTEETTELTYTVSLTANGRQVSGKGLKLAEKSAAGTYTGCQGKACSAFDINGTLDVDGDSLKAWFTEEGERSTTQLHLEWNGESWKGKFKSEAATSSGMATCSGTALLSPL